MSKDVSTTNDARSASDVSSNTNNSNTNSSVCDNTVCAIDMANSCDNTTPQQARLDIFFSPYRKARPRVHKTITEPSMTVPDQSYTVRELFERSVVNSMPDISRRQPYYSDEQNEDKLLEMSGIDLSTLDLVELDEYKRNLKRYIDQRNQQYQAELQRHRKAKKTMNVESSSNQEQILD